MASFQKDAILRYRGFDLAFRKDAILGFRDFMKK